MTNAEYYLKEGTNREELLDNFREFFIDNKEVIGNYSHRAILDNFLCAEHMPTLTEDERVILRNLDNYEIIGRTGKDLEGITDVYVSDEHTSESLYMFKPDLFQFIKERRRI